MNNRVKQIIATRHLCFSNIGEARRRELTINIYAPHLLQKGDVPYNIDEGVAGCQVEFDGLSEETRVVHGADTIQALEMAVDLDRTLRRLSRKYKFFWPSGEPYFDD